MSAMNEWELSKENILPITSGRKAGVLRTALAPHPEDQLLHRRKAFEQELRAYDGDDPLSVWCNYIKWVEQNYVKGGKESNLAKLVQQCLFILKEDARYKDDERFIDIWLKFAQMSQKPVEVYRNMYEEQNIGLKSARFFVAYSWAMEQLGNLKRADELLEEGINRGAQPLEDLKSARSMLEARLVQKFAAETNKSAPADLETEHRSAFTLLKTQEKNRAPICRIGPATTLPATRENLLVGRGQPQPKKNQQQSKVPFKIYNAENISSVPVLNDKAPVFVLNTEGSKENEKKPSKWTKVKVQSCAAKPKGPEFIVHKDDAPQPSSSSVKRGSTPDRVLTQWKKPVKPPVALFEPPDPKVRPMYNKMKVYGGTEEYSFEEIRAAVWFAKQKKLEKEKKRLEEEREKQEMKEQLEFLRKRVLELESKTLANRSSSLLESSMVVVQPHQVIMPVVHQFVESTAHQSIEPATHQSVECATHQSIDPSVHQSSEPVKASPCSVNVVSTAALPSNSEQVDGEQTHSATSLVKNIFVDLYDNSIWNCSKKDTSPINHLLKDVSAEIQSSLKKSQASITGSAENEQEAGINIISKKRPVLAIYHDPTEVLSNQNEAISKLHNTSSLLSAEKDQEAAIKNIKRPVLAIYHDSNEDLSSKNGPSSKIQNLSSMQEGVPESVLPTDSENLENIPPPDYVQSSEKRQMCGVLQPSKDIFYIPLEEQLRAQEEEEEEEDVEEECLAQPLPPCDDMTMIPPLNTMHFAMSARFASTPCEKPFVKPDSVETKVESIQSEVMELPEESRMLLHVLRQLLGINKCDRTHQLVLSTVDKVLNATNSQTLDTDLKMASDYLHTCLQINKDATVYEFLWRAVCLLDVYIKKLKSSSCQNDTAPTHAFTSHQGSQLSTIMENSREGSNKSSSSSSLSSASRIKTFSSLHRSSLMDSGMQSCPGVNAKSITKSPVANDNVSIVAKQDGEDEPIKTHCLEFDPFEKMVTDHLLNNLKPQITERANFFVESRLCTIKAGFEVKLGDMYFYVEKHCASGAYAKIYSASAIATQVLNMNSECFAIKVCKKLNAWEFYICTELKQRLATVTGPPDVMDSVIDLKLGVKFKDSIVLVSKLYEYGTLLDVVNVYKKHGNAVPECVAMYFALELLLIISRIHDCSILHCDIKPDNILMNGICTDTLLDNMKNKKTTCLQLIDFGRGLDLNFFEPGVVFTAKAQAEDFQCSEMREDRPWVFQIDWFGVMGCIHVLLFSEYMSVQKNSMGEYEQTSKFRRYWHVDIWQRLFRTFLNIPSCYSRPDVTPFVNCMTEALQKQSTNFLKKMKELSASLPTLYT